MANPILLKRGTAAGLAALVAANGLKFGELYFLTDQGRIALGLSVNTYEPFAKLSEVTSDPTKASLNGSATQFFAASQLRVGPAATPLVISQGAADNPTSVFISRDGTTTNSTLLNTTAVGYQAFKNGTGFYNTMFGSQAGTNTGSGTNNVGVGYSALFSATGDNNVGVGYSSLAGATGTNNVAVGSQTGASLTGSYNVFIGDSAGSAVTTGTYNTLIGAGAGTPTATTSGWIAIAANNATRVQFDGTAWTFFGRVNSAAGFASSSGEMNLKAATALSDANATLTAAQMKQGLFTISPTAARTLTSDSAASIIAGLSGYQVGSHYLFTVLNLSTFLVTMAPGAGVTWVGKLAINNGTGSFRAVVTSASTVTIYTEGSYGVAGVSGDVQYNLNGTLAAAANVEIDAGDLVLVATAAPTTPPVDRLKLFNKKSANRNMLAILGPSGLDMRMQPHFGTNKIATYIPSGNSAAATATGYSSAAIVGTLTARNVTTTNLLNRARRVGILSAATAAAFAGNYMTVAQITTGITIGGVPTGGFHKIFRFGISDPATVAGARMFVGISSLVAPPTNVEPSTLINGVGVGHGAADTNLKIFWGGSVAQAPIDLGGGFPLTANSAVMYELALFCPAGDVGANIVHYQVTNLTTNITAFGTLTAATAGTQLPLNTTLLSYARHYRTNNASAAAVALDIVGDYVDNDD
jgi:hypothetical protein